MDGRFGGKKFFQPSDKWREKNSRGRLLRSRSERLRPARGASSRAKWRPPKRVQRVVGAARARMWGSWRFVRGRLAGTAEAKRSRTDALAQWRANRKTDDGRCRHQDRGAVARILTERCRERLLQVQSV